MMFHRAPAEVNGFGVITSTPGLTRSSQVLMFFGLPLRVASTTTEFVTNPWNLFWSQFASTFPDLTSLSTSGASESSTTSALRPASTACSWSQEALYDWLTLEPFP